MSEKPIKIVLSSVVGVIELTISLTF